ncbi:MAG TPA: ABC transporter permease [Candidatus Margulisiibacteriota bacterium]|nr:ABC transporter permease [Candidatus Margulisiibacteriota bacterium]
MFSKRNLIRELILKDLKIRYSRPFLGFLWAFLSPLFIVAVFYVIFSLFLKVKIEEAPYLLYLMTAVLPWRFFQDSLAASTSSLMDNRNLIRESNFPHYLIPISVTLSNFVNFMPSLAILIIAALFILKGLPAFIIFLPLVLLIHLLITIGISIILSVLYTRWRDIKYILDVLLLVLFYLIPGFYPLRLAKDSLPPYLFDAYISNPLVGLLGSYRIVLLNGFYSKMKIEANILGVIFIPLCFSVIIFLLGLYVYQKNRYRINDYLAY